MKITTGDLAMSRKYTKVKALAADIFHRKATDEIPPKTRKPITLLQPSQHL